MTEICSALIGISSGAAGFLILTFWFKPILRYKELKSKILADLIDYANVIEINDLSEAYKARGQERIVISRKHAAELAAASYYLPQRYLKYINKKGEDPDKASVEMIGYSNTYRMEEAEIRVNKINNLLKLWH
jgi:hypothetical protein